MNNTFRKVAKVVWVIWIIMGALFVVSGVAWLGLAFAASGIISLLALRVKKPAAKEVPQNATEEIPDCNAPEKTTRMEPSHPASASNLRPDFIAVDFETATSDLSSACSIGIAAVSKGKIVDKYHALIQPPGNQYDDRNIAVHGITPEDTKKAPSASSVLPALIPYIASGAPIIAHNAHFDMSVLARSKGSLTIPDFEYIDTMDMARPFVSGGISLPQCAKYFGISTGHHHNALDDAVTCANVAVACINAAGAKDLSEFIQMFPAAHSRAFHNLKPAETFGSHSHTSSARIKVPNHRDIVPCPGEKDPNHPLFGKKIVFTGIMDLDRGTAMQMAADLGAVLRNNISGKTDYLVVGRQDMALVGSDGMSNKEEQAYELNNTGKAKIKIIDEKEFVSLCNGH